MSSKAQARGQRKYQHNENTYSVCKALFVTKQATYPTMSTCANFKEKVKFDGIRIVLNALIDQEGENENIDIRS